MIIDNNFQLALEMRLTEKRLADTLRQHSYKLTPQRRAIIRAMASSQDYLTPAGIYARLYQNYPNIGVVTIYRTLDLLTKLGLICELHAEGNSHSYTVSAMGHHHHLICSKCGVVVDFNCDLGEVPQNLSQETGFSIDGHLLEFTGICQDCQQKSR